MLPLDWLRALQPPLAHVYLLAKVLLALLVDDCPAGARPGVQAWFESTTRPVSIWRLQAVVIDHLYAMIRGPVSLSRRLATLPAHRRHLCDAPRKRKQQAAYARAWLASLQPAHA